ncbi:MAG: OmpA family protein [Myxococcales bacterium]|nr:OmpA family protein [Myxococcales bacterium]MDD9968307.1 OmpA family protein [Myxococcales bacterium]
MALEPDMLDGDCECEEGAPAWMATFSDLATLLLTFFVLLLSFAEMDVIEFREMLGSVREAFGVQFEHPGHIEALSTTVVELNDHEHVPWTPLNQRQVSAVQAIKRFIRQRKMDGEMEAGLSEQGVFVRLKDRLAFGVGDADVAEAAKSVFKAVHQLVSAFPEGLTIEGHTDDVPIKSSRYPSNWHLSSARAIAVLRYLESIGPLPKNVSVVGHADRQPLVPNNSAENRARNRRVEFVFQASELAKNKDSLKRAQEMIKRAEQADAASKPPKTAAPGQASGQPAGDPAAGGSAGGAQDEPFVKPLKPVVSE